MAFDAELRTHLEQLAQLEQVPRGPVFHRVDEHALRAYFLERLGALETSEVRPGVEVLFHIWSPRIGQLARYIANLPASAALDSAARVQELAERVLDVAMGQLPVERTELIERLEWERIAAQFLTQRTTQLERVEHYVIETYLVRDEPVSGPRLTALATAFLRLRGRDAIRWLITSEVLQSTGRWDPWRTPRELLEMALDERGITPRLDDDGRSSMPFDGKLLARLHQLGVLRAYGDLEGIDVYRAADAWRDAIRTILGTSPWHQAITAILAEDRTGFVPAQRVAAEDVSEQTKMIAHEVRNALIPARIQLDALRGAVSGPFIARVDAAKRGITRVLTFVEEMLVIVS